VVLKAVRSVKELASRARWFGPSLRKRRVSSRVFGAFTVIVCCLRAWGGRGGGLAAVILAYKVRGLTTVRGVEAIDEGVRARGARATGLDLIGLVYMPLI
jgi:hypothetical protein